MINEVLSPGDGPLGMLCGARLPMNKPQGWVRQEPSELLMAVEFCFEVFKVASQMFCPSPPGGQLSEGPKTLKLPGFPS